MPPRYVADPAPELTGYHPDAQVYTEMSPKRFLRNLGLVGVPGEEFYVSQRSMAALKERMFAGQEIDPLFIDYDPFQKKVVRHEGRHRALAAAELDIEKVPVIVYFYDQKEWHDVKNEEGTIYDQSHYIRLDELGEGRINSALARLGAERINVLRRRPMSAKLSRPHGQVYVRRYQRHR